MFIFVMILSGCAFAEQADDLEPARYTSSAGDEVRSNTIDTMERSAGSVAGEPMIVDPIAGDFTDEAQSGEVQGGEVQGGEVQGGEIQGGEVQGGEIQGGEVQGGEVQGGEVQGGEVQGGEASAGTVVEPVDQDQDGVPDIDDNCPEGFNPGQSDIDGDGEGDLCEADADFDGVPDAWDPAPQDANWPGRSLPDTIYAHTNSELFSFDVKDSTLRSVALFSFDQSSGFEQITDIAIDRAGVLWAISFERLWICHPRTGACRLVGTLPEGSYNGLTFLPGDLFMEERDILVAIDLNGTWRRLNSSGAEIEAVELGRYPVESSSGDVFSIEGVGTYAAVSRPGVEDNIIVAVNPLDPSDITDLATLEGYNSIFGVAGWQGELFAFDAGGAMLRVDLNTGAVSVVLNQANVWWGAGVSSVIYSTLP